MDLPNEGSLGTGRDSHVQWWVTTSDSLLTQEQIIHLFESHSSLNRTDLVNSGFLDLWGGAKVCANDNETSFQQAKNL